MEQIAAEAHPTAGAEEVFEVVGPAIDEVFAIDEAVDQVFRASSGLCHGGMS